MSRFTPVGDHRLAMNVLRAGLVALAGLVASGCPPKCPTGQVDCGGVCKDLQTDFDNCGECGKSCPSGGSCSAGACGCPASAPDRCGSQCVDLKTSAAHCGACGHACGLGACNAGACTCNTTPSTVTRCPGAAIECVDVASDPRNCSACGAACSGGKVCSSSNCVCPAARPDECGGQCVNTMSDPNHCSRCGMACTAKGAACVAGQCGCPASAPTLCSQDNSCVDLTNDLQHCGSCTTPCARDGGTCSQSMCRCPASAPDYCAASNRCTDLSADPTNCGSCGFRCGEAACVNRQCCGDGGVVCAGLCCAGAACCAGNTCPLAHANGLGGQYYDCNPLGSTRLASSQKAAADSWKPGSDLTGVPCANTLCLRRQAADQCALFCENGRVTASVVGSIVCLCEEMNPPIVSTWN